MPSIKSDFINAALADVQGGSGGGDTTAISASIGDLTKLTTSNKTSLVTAINELDTDIASNAADIEAAKNASYTKAEIDKKLAAVPTGVTEAQVNTAIANKVASYYTKTEVDTKITELNTKIAAVPTGVTEAQVNTAIANKVASYYTKTETDSKITELTNLVNSLLAATADYTQDVTFSGAMAQYASAGQTMTQYSTSAASGDATASGTIISVDNRVVKVRVTSGTFAANYKVAIGDTSPYTIVSVAAKQLIAKE